jgi:ABC-type Fe3+/spermidine/putrescine transport system ATPase subunit/ABC-type sulfate transport system permease component
MSARLSIARSDVTRRAPAPLFWLAGLLSLYLIAPLIAGVQQAGLADWSSVDREALLRACAISIASATVATAIIALAGIPLGYVLARFSGWRTGLVGFLVQLPLALPPLTSGVLLLFLVGYGAPLGRLTHGALTDSFIGIVLAEVFVAAPFLIIAARSAFSTVDPVLEGIGATLGRRPMYVFLHVSLPIAWPTILSGLLLAWLRAFGEFGATVMVAYHPYSLPVYTYVAFGSQGLPAMLPVLLPTLVLAVAVMGLSGVLARKSRRDGDVSSAIGALPAAASTARAPVRPAEIDLRLEKQLGSFRLDLAWSARARRLAILGPSGSGKSLTLKLIAGLERIDQGRVGIDGEDRLRIEPAARAIAYVPQNYGLFPHLTVAEHLSFPLGAAPDAAAHWIDRLGLAGLEQRRPAALSLGQQQRVALARALVRPASLLLLDEPFSALDTPLRTRLRRELFALQGELAGATILVTHDPAEAALLADELLVLEAGVALQSGPTERVFRRPANETVARLLGADNVADGVAAGPDRIAIGGGVMLEVAGPSLRSGQRVGWSFSPARARTRPGGRYEGVVESAMSAGIERQITVRLGDARIRISDGHADIGGDRQCSFDIDPDSVQVWPLE